MPVWPVRARRVPLAAVRPPVAVLPGREAPLVAVDSQTVAAAALVVHHPASEQVASVVVASEVVVLEQRLCGEEGPPFFWVANVSFELAVHPTVTLLLLRERRVLSLWRLIWTWCQEDRQHGC